MENDEPYGLIQFTTDVMIVHEWQGIVEIPVVRTGMYQALK